MAQPFKPAVLSHPVSHTQMQQENQANYASRNSGIKAHTKHHGRSNIQHPSAGKRTKLSQECPQADLYASIIQISSAFRRRSGSKGQSFREKAFTHATIQGLAWRRTNASVQEDGTAMTATRLRVNQNASAGAFVATPTLAFALHGRQSCMKFTKTSQKWTLGTTGLTAA